MSANNWMAQDLADILNLPVERPEFVETTALGTAMLAAAGAGIHADLESSASAMRGQLQEFAPTMPEHIRSGRLAAWRKALAAA
jgi:glycerol kinase